MKDPFRVIHSTDDPYYVSLRIEQCIMRNSSIYIGLLNVQRRGQGMWRLDRLVTISTDACIKSHSYKRTYNRLLKVFPVANATQSRTVWMCACCSSTVLKHPLTESPVESHIFLL